MTSGKFEGVFSPSKIDQNVIDEFLRKVATKGSFESAGIENSAVSCRVDGGQPITITRDLAQLERLKGKDDIFCTWTTTYPFDNDEWDSTLRIQRDLGRYVVKVESVPSVLAQFPKKHSRYGMAWNEEQEEVESSLEQRNVDARLYVDGHEYALGWEGLAALTDYINTIEKLSEWAKK